ncbi:MAG: ferritin-like domain-containing protein [Cytophagaceae bacterium]|nr:ferritin-like domain-containing protein [Cytophagaceae bacterium]
MKIKTFNDLFTDQIKDLYNAESQMLKALPKMAKKATDTKLKASFEKHLEQTKVQKERLEKVCEILDIKPTGKKCAAMEGLIEEAKEIIENVKDPYVLDAGLIAASQKVEHYEIASYGTLAEFAKELGNQEVLDILVETLKEEKETDVKLTLVAKKEVNKEAVHQ